MKTTEQNFGQLADNFPLLEMANKYNEITRESVPNMTARVALKEQLIANMATYIHDTPVPLAFGLFALSPGLRAGFSRAIGEAGDASFFTFVAIRSYTGATGPLDYNLKHQVVRAYRELQKRFPDNTDIGAQASADVAHLEDNADQELTGHINMMKTELGIS